MRITSLTILVTLACCKSLPDHTITREDHLIPAKGGIQLHIREISPSNQIQGVPLVMIHGGGPGTTASFDLPVAGGSFAQKATTGIFFETSPTSVSLLIPREATSVKARPVHAFVELVNFLAPWEHRGLYRRSQHIFEFN